MVRVEEYCSACGKLLTVWQATDVLYTIKRCRCFEVACPCCPDCHALLETPALRAYDERIRRQGGYAVIVVGRAIHT